MSATTAPTNARAPATAGGKARALAPTAPPPAASASARAPAEVEDAAPAPPPLANLFKLCGVDGMKNITREGNVATVHDKFLGRKVLVVQGNVPAANFARLPKVGRPALGLTGGFLYAQVKLDPERVFAVHVDLICRDSSDESRSNASVGYQIGRKTVRLSLTNLYRRKTAPEPSGRASPSRTSRSLAGGSPRGSTFARGSRRVRRRATWPKR